MQTNPLLEQLDWFSTSVNWTLDFPNTMVTPWPGPHLIMFLAGYQLRQGFPSPMFFALKIFGPFIVPFLILCIIHGIRLIVTTATLYHFCLLSSRG